MWQELNPFIKPSLPELLSEIISLKRNLWDISINELNIKWTSRRVGNENY
jgi:hypothetical protein